VLFRALAFDPKVTLVDVEMAHHLGHLDVARQLGMKGGSLEIVARCCVHRGLAPVPPGVFGQLSSGFDR
jgi:hypothetical protein